MTRRAYALIVCLLCLLAACKLADEAWRPSPFDDGLCAMHPRGDCCDTP